MRTAEMTQWVELLAVQAMVLSAVPAPHGGGKDASPECPLNSMCTNIL